MIAAQIADELMRHGIVSYNSCSGWHWTKDESKTAISDSDINKLIAREINKLVDKGLSAKERKAVRLEVEGLMNG